MRSIDIPQGQSDYPVDDLSTARDSDVATQVPGLYRYPLK